jgi:hypothetical protein
MPRPDEPTKPMTLGNMRNRGLQGTSELGLSRFAHTGCRGDFFDAMLNLVQTPVI